MLEDAIISITNAIIEPDQKFYLWKQNGKWWGQIQGDVAEQFPDSIAVNAVEDREWDHSSMTEIQLAKRIVKVLGSHIKVYSPELDTNGKQRRLA